MFCAGTDQTTSRPNRDDLHPKVSNDEPAVCVFGAIEDVFRLEVTMDNVMRMEVGNTVEDGTNDPGSIGLGKLAALCDALEKLASNSKFESEVVLFARLEPLVKLDDVGVVEATKDLHLSPHSGFITLDALLGDGLDRNR